MTRAMQDLAADLRIIVEAIADDAFKGTEALIIVRCEDGHILSADSDLTLSQASDMSRDFMAVLSDCHKRYLALPCPRGGPQRCTGIVQPARSSL